MHGLRSRRNGRRVNGRSACADVCAAARGIRWRRVPRRWWRVPGGPLWSSFLSDTCRAGRCQPGGNRWRLFGGPLLAPILSDTCRCGRVSKREIWWRRVARRWWLLGRPLRAPRLSDICHFVTSVGGGCAFLQRGALLVAISIFAVVVPSAEGPVSAGYIGDSSLGGGASLACRVQIAGGGGWAE